MDYAAYFTDALAQLHSGRLLIQASGLYIELPTPVLVGQDEHRTLGTVESGARRWFVRDLRKASQPDRGR